MYAVLASRPEDRAQIMIAEDSCLQGIKIGQKEHTISQFADDTLFMLKGYEQLPRMWSTVEQYNNATAMKTN
eukprot:3239369-Pleurochrysis_carterae.AAC.1